ncbi:unnamed protein product [Spodoptera littoralis]|uniref:Uncharacterized protein n=1 Tax=Spodoptera littoralis TaxID=7109 RepID=A0A9P0IGU2_SPOLI|nr:unnamed protein product [Spodoptera littoralis]CAH1646489.1 unnamed protein product [Spodoptera littoralis]
MDLLWVKQDYVEVGIRNVYSIITLNIIVVFTKGMQLFLFFLRGENHRMTAPA